MRKLIQYQMAAVLTLLIVGCAQLGISAPETFNQKLAVGYGTVTQIRETTTILLEAKKINADDAQNVQNAADGARAGLDIARKLGATDPTAADTKLTAVRSVLTALSGYLATRGAK